MSVEERASLLSINTEQQQQQQQHQHDDDASIESSKSSLSALSGLSRWLDLIRCYALLGLISFGGPQAHMAVLRVQVVEQRKWFAAHTFNELMSLCSAIPGPSSSQLIFATATARCGILGGILGYLLFFLPGFVVMLTLGSLYHQFNFVSPWWLADIELGLSAAALVLIASNAVALAKQLCTQLITQLICLISLCIALFFNAYWYTFPALFVASGITTLVYFSIRPQDLKMDASQESDKDEDIRINYGKAVGVVSIILSWCALIIMLVLSLIYTQNSNLVLAEIFYRTGTIVFGGGNVILSMFLSQLVPQFLNHNQVRGMSYIIYLFIYLFI
jgi:chromate transporter